MPISDLAVVGQPIIDESHFADGFRDDFETLSIEASSEPGNRDGKWKKGFMHANIAKNGFIYGSDENPLNGDDFVHAAINFERQVYVDNRKPAPTGFNPFSTQSSVLTISSRLAAGSEIDYARVKDFDLNPDGSLGAFKRNKQAKYLSGKISSYGRYAQSFGRVRARVKTPYGADGSSTDVNDRSAVFPAALWGLQDVPYGCDVNGDPLPNPDTTYRPGRPNGGGILAELDGDENFGESTSDIHQTTHFHPPGTPQGQSQSSPKTINTGKDLRNDWRETGYDLFPEKVVFFADGVYTHEVVTPDEIRNGLNKYIPVPGAEYNVQMTSANVAATNGKQTHADGSTRYMCFVLISNLARDGKFPRDFAKQLFDAGTTLPPHQDSVSMEIDYIEARPLITDNPDKFPVRINGVPTAISQISSNARSGVRPIVENEISFKQAHESGEVVYQLKKPLAGSWDFSSYGSGAQAIGPTNSPVLRLKITEQVSVETPRTVKFIPS